MNTNTTIISELRLIRENLIAPEDVARIDRVLEALGKPAEHAPRAICAGMAMAGYNANTNLTGHGAHYLQRVQWAVRDADALIAELAKKPSVD